ncbi:Hypp8944 [Branchiostoma lanceolatum]|uniref:Hypp8944 protein n=1 Tax=Branchiostoma lanceolatum TaxID=7740 RepID=A0A8J9ZAJ0_BRALA|nr:Hypp8944 [Branchiostoma lanceolatum]
MLRVCEKLREVDARSRRLGLVRAETDYLRALLDAMADMDRCVEVEVLKSLGDVNLEKGRLDKNPDKFDRAMMLYRTALLRCEDADVGESLTNRYLYAEKLRLGKVPTDAFGYEPLSSNTKMTSLAKIAEKFLNLDRSLTVAVGYDKTSILLEYTKLMIEGIVTGDNTLEVEAIKSIGDGFLKTGTMTEDTTYLTKATALYNTALARCERVQGTVALIHRLLYTAKIREATRRTGNKYKDRRRGRLSYANPVTTDVDVTVDVTGPQFMSYDEYLTAGDRALTERDLELAEQKFASALKLIHDSNKPDRPKEADCLYRMGNVYVQRGKITKEGRKFTQAAALYNAAMARTEVNKDKVMKCLRETEQSFLKYIVNVDSKPSSFDRDIRHKEKLQSMRTSVKSQLEAIDQQHNPYQYDEDDSKMKAVEVERAEAVKALFKSIAKDRQVFIQDLVSECIEVVGPPPCKYAFIGLGSQATELVTPYSDLEFAILIEEGRYNDDTPEYEYFTNLTHYLHLKVINLGETILPAMAIPSLNDFQSEDQAKDWFFDSITPRGFAFDGFMPWASKTPFGRERTKTKSSVSLIQTPAVLAMFQLLKSHMSEWHHLSDILRRVSFLVGEESLVNEYMDKLREITTDPPRARFMSRLSAVVTLFDDRGHLSSLEPTGQLLNVKKDIYRFPGIAIELLALCCQITAASTWNVIDIFKETELVQEENANHLLILTSISAELRIILE